MKKSRWDQVSTPLSTIPVLSVRNPVVYKLISHIEYLTKQFREQPNHLRDKIKQLETEIFILKNENAKLKSKDNLSSSKNIEKRLIALEDISNRLINKKSDYSDRRERSNSNEKRAKRQRKYQINDD